MVLRLAAILACLCLTLPALSAPALARPVAGPEAPAPLPTSSLDGRIRADVERFFRVEVRGAYGVETEDQIDHAIGFTLAAIEREIALHEAHAASTSLPAGTTYEGLVNEGLAGASALLAACANEAGQSPEDSAENARRAAEAPLDEIYHRGTDGQDPACLMAITTHLSGHAGDGTLAASHLADAGTDQTDRIAKLRQYYLERLLSTDSFQILVRSIPQIAKDQIALAFKSVPLVGNTTRSILADRCLDPVSSVNDPRETPWESLPGCASGLAPEASTMRNSGGGGAQATNRHFNCYDAHDWRAAHVGLLSAFTLHAPQGTDRDLDTARALFSGTFQQAIFLEKEDSRYRCRMEVYCPPTAAYGGSAVGSTQTSPVDPLQLGLTALVDVVPENQPKSAHHVVYDTDRKYEGGELVGKLRVWVLCSAHADSPTMIVTRGSERISFTNGFKGGRPEFVMHTAKGVSPADQWMVNMLVGRAFDWLVAKAIAALNVPFSAIGNWAILKFAGRELAPLMDAFFQDYREITPSTTYGHQVGVAYKLKKPWGTNAYAFKLFAWPTPGTTGGAFKDSLRWDVSVPITLETTIQRAPNAGYARTVFDETLHFYGWSHYGNIEIGVDPTFPQHPGWPS